MGPMAQLRTKMPHQPFLILLLTTAPQVWEEHERRQRAEQAHYKKLCWHKKHKDLRQQGSHDQDAYNKNHQSEGYTIDPVTAPLVWLDDNWNHYKH